MIPDNWVLIDTGFTQKVLAGWVGEYLEPDLWRLSSGATSIEDCLDYWKITNVSGSVYICYKNREGFCGVMNGVYDTLVSHGAKRIEVEGMSV